jgi:hypothetical protein
MAFQALRWPLRRRPLRCRVRRFTCRAKPPAEVHHAVACKKGHKRVRWQIHAD